MSPATTPDTPVPHGCDSTIPSSTGTSAFSVDGRGTITAAASSAAGSKENRPDDDLASSTASDAAELSTSGTPVHNAIMSPIGPSSDTTGSPASGYSMESIDGDETGLTTPSPTSSNQSESTATLPLEGTDSPGISSAACGPSKNYAAVVRPGTIVHAVNAAEISTIMVGALPAAETTATTTSKASREEKRSWQTTNQAHSGNGDNLPGQNRHTPARSTSPTASMVSFGTTAVNASPPPRENSNDGARPAEEPASPSQGTPTPTSPNGSKKRKAQEALPLPKRTATSPGDTSLSVVGTLSARSQVGKLTAHAAEPGLFREDGSNTSFNMGADATMVDVNAPLPGETSGQSHSSTISATSDLRPASLRSSGTPAGVETQSRPSPESATLQKGIVHARLSADAPGEKTVCANPTTPTQKATPGCATPNATTECLTMEQLAAVLAGLSSPQGQSTANALVNEGDATSHIQKSTGDMVNSDFAPSVHNADMTANSAAETGNEPQAVENDMLGIDSTENIVDPSRGNKVGAPQLQAMAVMADNHGNTMDALLCAAGLQNQESLAARSGNGSDVPSHTRQVMRPAAEITALSSAAFRKILGMIRQFLFPTYCF